MALRYVHWDQLSLNLASLKDIDKQHDVVLICELNSLATHVKHHMKKLVFLFSSMRHFAKELEKKGIKVIYVKLDDPNNTHNIADEITRHQKGHAKIILTEASEYFIQKQFEALAKSHSITILEDDRFLANHQDFAQWAEGKKQLRMEFFYREMRKRYQILMDGDKPEGGKWNYDSDNRKPPKQGLKVPLPTQVKPDSITMEVMDLVKNNFKHFGDLEPFFYAVTRKDALKVLHEFIEQRLVLFGDYQDAMVEGEAWMFHSHISFYLNNGLLLPMECILAAQIAYDENRAPLSATEGFIRQILGWREFIRGIYWLKMPSYAEDNFLNAKQPLPEFFWDGQTDMNCIKQVVNETKAHAYAHHIQRLMVIGNFSLIAGLDPKAVNEWFWIVYCDAYQWVELPNVSGMALFADGGVLGSKPYCSSGAYINKMSNYCKGCRYNVKEKLGEDACPFNYLYWDFLIRNYDKLHDNQRLSFMYNMLNKMSAEQKQAITQSSKAFLKSINPTQ